MSHGGLQIVIFRASAHAGAASGRQHAGQRDPEGNTGETPGQRRNVAHAMMQHDQVLQRGACAPIGVDLKKGRRERAPDLGEIRGAMQEIAERRCRFGYRRIGIMPGRKGMNDKTLCRLLGRRLIHMPKTRLHVRPEQPHTNVGVNASGQDASVCKLQAIRQIIQDFLSFFKKKFSYDI